MKLKLLFVGLLFGVILPVQATHNRAGEITYEHLGGLTYEITITTYTKASSTQADRCQLDVSFGDGSTSVVPRSNGQLSTRCPGARQGILLGNDIKWNEYVTTHTFPSSGTYRISMEDPNRNINVLNIPNSVTVVFYIESEIIIPITGTPNSSPRLTNPPIDNACLFRVYEHNPGAVDQDLANNGFSDSLSYRIVECLREGGAPITGFEQPNMISPGPNNQLSIDAVTGTLTWAAPQQEGEYNVAILIEEWRRLPNGEVIKVGSVLRDMQIDVSACNNLPPQVRVPSDTCVTAGTTLNMDITAVDPDPGNEVTLSARGEPFNVAGNVASFPERTGIGTVTSTFTWDTECRHIRATPYSTILRAEDNNPFDPNHIPLSDYEVFYIDVKGPPPTNEQATPQGPGIQLDWDYNVCTNNVGYRVYRRIDSASYVPTNCVTGLPPGLGYQLIATITDPQTTSYYDDDNGRGLNQGLRYCYLVHAFFPDGSEGYVTLEFCSRLLRDVPVITRVSVNETSVTNGSDSIEWAPPTEFDPVAFPGPYQYRIFRRALLGDFTEVGATNSNADLSLVDSVFVDQGLNTTDIQYTYRIELYSDGILVGASTAASSVFTESLSLDNRITLTWQADVPWVNDSFRVFREDDNGIMQLLGIVTEPIYRDSGLVNGREYCYLVQSIGDYSVSGFISPIRNFSQRLCAIPVDLQEPCPPTGLRLQSDCDLFTNSLSWNNPNNLCDTVDDVVGYNVYYKPFLNSPFQLVLSVSGDDNTNALFEDLNASVAGCYAVTAVDSFNNESALSDSICADNCPIYELPNVFTPGGDGKNDIFGPFPYRFVERVDMQIFNRWGALVHETEDPNINWEGMYKNTNEELPDGTYFYVCTVYEIRLQGLVPRVLKGHITLLRQSVQFPSN